MTFTMTRASAGGVGANANSGNPAVNAVEAILTPMGTRLLPGIIRVTGTVI